MIASRSYRNTLKHDLQTDADFRRALLSEVLGCMESGDVDTAKSVLHKYIDATIGFYQLGKGLGRSPVSLTHLLSQRSHVRAHDFFEIVAYLQQLEGTVVAGPATTAIAA